MRPVRAVLRKLLMMVSLSLCLLSQLWSDESSLRRGLDSTKLCYCACDQHAGTPICTHMCDLPKYEKRSWATSCHRRIHTDIAPVPHSSSRKRNRIEDARMGR